MRKRGSQSGARVLTHHRLYAGVLATLMVVGATGTVHAQQQDASREYTVQAGSMEDALNQLARQAKVQIVFPPELVQGKRAPAVSGQQTWKQALEKLLQGSGLVAGYINDSTVAIRKAEAAQPPPPPRQAPQQQTKAAAEDEAVTEFKKLTVTGSRVKGAELTSPLVMITSEDMRLSGHPSLGEVLRVVPQNFSGGQNPGVVDSTEGGLSNQNVSGGSSFNLRGLGPDATLTLLNSSRLVYDGLFQGVDIDAIPVAAVDRVEVLLDGASAIYGSDAVAGVVNVILKRDYSGAEVSARLGTSTGGGYTQSQYTGVAGTTWDSGGLIFTTSISRNTPVSSGQRDYLADVGPDYEFYPGMNQKNLVLSGHQKIGESAELAVDGFYSDRDGRQSITEVTGWKGVSGNDGLSWGMYPSLSFFLRDDTSLKLHAVFGRNKINTSYDGFIATGEQQAKDRSYFENKTTGIGLEVSGTFAQLPAGPIGYSVGGGYREITYAHSEGGFDLEDGSYLIYDEVSPKSEKSRYAYGEIDLPLVSEDSSIPLVRRLSINGAVRYESYESFGESTTPKIGLFWGLSPSLDIKASWGRSFKIPTLLQQHQARAVRYRSSMGYAGAPEDRTLIYTFGGGADLRPEEATVVTAGFAFRPKFLEGMSLELNWFDIDYFDRVVRPHANLTVSLVDPASEDYRIINPSLDEINREFEISGVAPGTFLSNTGNADGSPRPYNPDDVYAIIQNRYINAAGNKIRGIDFSARYAMDLSGGILTLSGNGNWITDSTRQLNPLAPEVPNVGVMYTPPKFKGRVAAVWSRDAFTLSTAVNYIGRVLNDFIEPPYQGDAMTTVDLVLDYWMDSERLGELGINFGIINLLNQRPPYIRKDWPEYNMNFDPTNYSALGRMVNLTLTKRF